jgi:large subunit ribosomal protein L3
VEAGEILQEFRVPADVVGQYAPGATVPVTLFAVGQTVDVQGTSIGKGFTGTIKRHNFSSQRASHGNSRSHNVPGSISMAQDPGRVFPGKKMSGHLGDVTVRCRTWTSCASTKPASCCWCAARCRAPRAVS